MSITAPTETPSTTMGVVHPVYTSTTMGVVHPVYTSTTMGVVHPVYTMDEVIPASSLIDIQAIIQKAAQENGVAPSQVAVVSDAFSTLLSSNPSVESFDALGQSYIYSDMVNDVCYTEERQPKIFSYFESLPTTKISKELLPLSPEMIAEYNAFAAALYGVFPITSVRATSDEGLLLQDTLVSNGYNTANFNSIFSGATTSYTYDSIIFAKYDNATFKPVPTRGEMLAEFMKGYVKQPRSVKSPLNDALAARGLGAVNQEPPLAFVYIDNDQDHHDDVGAANLKNIPLIARILYGSNGNNKDHQTEAYCYAESSVDDKCTSVLCSTLPQSAVEVKGYLTFFVIGTLIATCVVGGVIIARQRKSKKSSSPRSTSVEDPALENYHSAPKSFEQASPASYSSASSDEGNDVTQERQGSLERAQSGQAHESISNKNVVFEKA